MGNNGYDIPINEVAKILEKSDRQVRRYVKERRIKAKPVRVDGHIKLMFDKTEVVSFKDKYLSDGVMEEVVEAQLVDESDDVVSEASAETPKEEAVASPADSEAVKYVIDALKDELRELKTENKDLHYQLEQRSGQVGFLQGKIEALQDEVKALMPAPKPEHVPFLKRFFGRGKTSS